MAPQLYLTMYKEQFASPGTAKRAQLRPTSAHRRNNPQPRPDFLFPKSLQSNYSPVVTCRDNYLITGKPNLMPPVNPSPAQALPSADALQKLQLTEPPSGTEFKLHAAWRKPTARAVYSLSALQLRQHAGAQLRTRPQTTNPQYHSLRRSSSQNNSGCYSCFHVVKPFQAGHYIIHPEFVSESLR
ncbi:Nonribosomal peptide synthetase dtxS1 [Dissostichus eleginoides]|uniref:Nonribosomal peptide synthetase dtxS1 n=1 Tax=Dissostichus eleginoides TaxID=100907 RepID=A0AAD9CHT5_DISEL|nr:Nonribosomal peptide synthetase dtxS1 [Dissostichus eleginoides]